MDILTNHCSYHLKYAKLPAPFHLSIGPRESGCTDLPLAWTVLIPCPTLGLSLPYRGHFPITYLPSGWRGWEHFFLNHEQTADGFADFQHIILINMTQKKYLKYHWSALFHLFYVVVEVKCHANSQSLQSSDPHFSRPSLRRAKGELHHSRFYYRHLSKRIRPSSSITAKDK